MGLTATFTFTPVDVPFAGTTETDTNGVNNSAQIVGFYFDASGGGLIAGHFFDNTGEHGFVEDGQSFSAIDVPFVE
jgi:hypothetical protein